MKLRRIAVLGIAVGLLACGSDQVVDVGDEEPPLGSIEGHVRQSATSEPLVGALIELSGLGGLSADTLSDDSGDFAFNNLKPGEYTLDLTLPIGFEEAGATTIPVTVASAQVASVSFEGAAITSVVTTVNPGDVDTISTAGAVVEIDASSATGAIDVAVNALAPEDFGPSGLISTPLAISIKPSGSPSPATQMLGIQSAAGHVKITIEVTTSSDPTGSEFAFDIGDTEPLILYADVVSTTFVDPNTGFTKTTALHSFGGVVDAPIDAKLAVVARTTLCDNRRLEALDGDESPGGKIPLILVHGWQPFKVDCKNFDKKEDGVILVFKSIAEETFEAFLNHQKSSPTWSTELNSKYKTYILNYPSFEHVLTTSAYLRAEMQARGWGSAVIMGHSMGGLVGRGVLASSDGPDLLRGLLTLGTPHEGSPIADHTPAELFTTIDASCMDDLGITATFVINLAEFFGVDLFRETDGFRDLSRTSDLISTFKGATSQGNKVFTYAGQIGGAIPTGGTVFEDFLAAFACAINQFESATIPSDGVVPVASAVPTWTTIQSVFDGAHHVSITGHAAILTEVDAALQSLASCMPAPAVPTENDFVLSAAFARIDDRTIGVTMNPIIVNGNVVTGVKEENITIIENGCAIPIDGFVSGNIGVDLVFVQDLSGSMGGAITGVRTSVINFAAELAAGGFNVVMGSVGYSGPGTIPTTPPSSSCEFLGPVLDLTDAATFQAHVTARWLATGGCDLPENGLEAIEYAHERLGWRSGAVRAYIDITDISHHWSGTDCNGRGPCTDHDLTSITALIGPAATIHVVAPADPFLRNFGGGLDPWELATATGGTQIDLGFGVVDLTAVGITEVIGETISYTFSSASSIPAQHELRIRVEIVVDGATMIAELASGAILYSPMHSTLRAGR